MRHHLQQDGKSNKEPSVTESPEDVDKDTVGFAISWFSGPSKLMLVCFRKFLRRNIQCRLYQLVARGTTNQENKRNQQITGRRCFGCKLRPKWLGYVGANHVVS